MTEQPKWTPGPWELDGIAIAGSDHRTGDVCLMGEPAQYPGDTARMCDNWGANAHLIAAAPDLYAALQAMDDTLCDGYDTQAKRMAGRKALIAARAALSKARGDA